MIESKTSRKRLWVKIDLIKLAIVALTIKVMCSNSILLPWNSFLDNFCVVIGVLVFALFTAYDMQSLKRAYTFGGDDTMKNQLAVLGALHLYISFVAMFQYILGLLNRD